MLFFFKNKKITVDCFTSDASVYKLFKIRKAINFFPEEIKKFVLLQDATSAVNLPGLEHLAKDFIDEMVSKGMKLSTTTTYFN